ncbi:hypothetical protein KI387_031679, partial [Taxus chinensis]
MDKGTTMVSIKKEYIQRMPWITRDVDLEPILVTTRAEATSAREVSRQKNLVSREEVIHGKYLDPTHQK